MLVDVSSFDEIAAEFRRRIERTIWCTMTTVDTRGRPRGRLVHPVWEEPTGWLATFRQSFKAKHLEANPWVSLAFWDQEQEQVYVDAHTTWVDDDATKARLWELYSTKPEGYPLSGFWKGIDDPNYGLLRLDPWRIELWSVKGLFARTPPQVWRSPESGS
jgi:general stress protein 26